MNVRNIEIRDIGQNIGKLDLVGELPEIQHALMTQVTRVLESNLKLEDYLTHTQCQVEEQTQEIERADKALYEPKEQAQNKPYCFGDEELGPRRG